MTATTVTPTQRVSPSTYARADGPSPPPPGCRRIRRVRRAGTARPRTRAPLGGRPGGRRAARHRTGPARPPSGTPPPTAGRTSRHAPRPVAAAPTARMGGAGGGARRHRVPRDGAAEATAPRLGLRLVAGRLDRPARNRDRLLRHCPHRYRGPAPGRDRPRGAGGRRALLPRVPAAADASAARPVDSCRPMSPCSPPTTCRRRGWSRPASSRSCPWPTSRSGPATSGSASWPMCCSTPPT